MVQDNTANDGVRPPSPETMAAVQSAISSPTETAAVGTLRTPPASQWDEEPPLVKKWKLRLYLAAAAVCIALLILAVAFTLHYTSTTKQQGFFYCDTISCNSYAVMLSGTIKAAHSPCDNFYNYVCDGWRRKSSVHADHISNFLDDLGKTLKREVPRRHQRATDKAAGFYQSCRRVATSKDGELENFRGIFNECGIEWPIVSQQPDVLRSLARLHRRLALQNILNIRMADDGGTPILNLYVGPTTERMYTRATQIKSYGKYAEYYQRFQRLFKVPGTRDEDLLKYTQLVETEDKIYRGLLNYSKQFLDWPVQNLSQLAALTDEIPYERWAEVVTSELGLPADTPVHIATGDYDYIKAFSQLFATVGERYLHHQVGWVALQAIAPFINRESLEIYGGSRSNAISLNFYMCLPLSEVFMGWALYARYASSKLDVKTAKDIEDIIGTVAAAASLKVSIPLQIAHNRVEFGRVLSGQLMQYPSKFHDLVLLDATFSNISDMGPQLAINWINAVAGRDKTNWTMWRSQEVLFGSQIWGAFSYTFYNDYSKTFLLPPHVLTLPVYEPDLSTAVKYGAFGLLVGNAALGILQYPAQGVLKTGCLKESSSSDLTVLLRAASLQIAWDAYQNASVRQPYVRLRRLAKLSEKHIFFIVSCYILCGQSREHEPTRSCNDPLRHHPHFSKVFFCPPGTAMNPRRKCQLF